MRTEKTPLTSDPTACTSTLNSISIQTVLLPLVHVCARTQYFPIDLLLRGVSVLSKSIHIHLSSASRVGWALNHLNPTLRETWLVPCSDSLTNDIGQDAVAGDPRRGMGPISGQVHHHPGPPWASPVRYRWQGSDWSRHP